MTLELPEYVVERLRREYDGVFPAGHLTRHVEDHLGLDVARAQERLVHAIDPPPARLLDIGAGYGSFVLAALDAGFDARGVEVAGTELRYARSRLPEDPARFIEGDAAALPIADGVFDVVTLWNVLEHVERRTDVLREAARVLRPGGALVALAPNYAAFRREAHYHVMWAPFLRGPLAASYLRARHRDPRFFEEQVRPCTNREVRRTLHGLGVRIESLTALKLRDASTFAGGRTRRLATALERWHLTPLATRAAEVLGATTLSPTIAIVGRTAAP